MKYDSSSQAVKNYFNKYDSRVVPTKDKYTDSENTKIEENFKEEIERIIQKSDS